MEGKCEIKGSYWKQASYGLQRAFANRDQIMKEPSTPQRRRNVAELNFLMWKETIWCCVKSVNVQLNLLCIKY